MEDINKRFQDIEDRLSGIESELKKVAGSVQAQERAVQNRADTDRSVTDRSVTERSDLDQETDLEEFRLFSDHPSLEQNIGRHGLAWMGNLVLLLGIIFLTQWIISLGKPLTASIAGFAAVGGLLGLQYLIRQSNASLSFLFKIVGLFLLYYFTLRLHFFTDDPLIGGETISLVLVSAVVLFQLYLGIRQKKELFAILAILLGYFTALAGGKHGFLLGSTVFLAGITLYLVVSEGWRRTFIISMLAGYLVYLIWILNNPLMGNQMAVISEHHAGYVYLFLYVVLFATLPLFRAGSQLKPEYLAASLWLNSLGFSLILLVMILQFFADRYAGLFTALSLLCIAYAFILGVRGDWRFGSAFFALYGFLALSIAIYGVFGLPRSYLYLAAESLLVVSVALWFRNRLIVIMNGILFTFLLIAYFASGKQMDSINIAYALVPLITARVLNWKKERLEIKTDMLRNLYLVVGFVAVLYALYQAVPGQYVSLSWTIVAVLYFVMSFVLENVKYRYMGISTMVAVALHLFLVDMAKIEIAYRVMAFLVLAVISIAISIYYSRRAPHKE